MNEYINVDHPLRDVLVANGYKIRGPKLHKQSGPFWRRNWVVLDQQGTPLWEERFWTRSGAFNAWIEFYKVKP
jgi:hypothetical protein